jgi:transcriptional regulator of heat shock response
MKLNARQKQVLKTVVEEYVKHSTAVGSSHIVEMLAEQVSSATIRNVMAELTDFGLLAQPHTSAGRIPTEAGFKAYIQTMMVEQKELSLKQQAVLEAHFKKLRNLQDRFKEAARMLSELSGSVGLLMDETDKVYMSGLSNLPKLPEFRDEEFGSEFMELLENPAESLKQMSKSGSSQMRVLFGSDNPMMRNASVVITRFGPGGKKVISVIGPMRMSYGRTLPAMQYIKQILDTEL